MNPAWAGATDMLGGKRGHEPAPMERLRSPSHLEHLTHPETLKTLGGQMVPTPEFLWSSATSVTEGETEASKGLVF